jgi:hypothetical protein
MYLIQPRYNFTSKIKSERKVLTPVHHHQSMILKKAQTIPQVMMKKMVSLLARKLPTTLKESCLRKLKKVIPQ